jgi:hypothetical protein
MGEGRRESTMGVELLLEQFDELVDRRNSAPFVQASSRLGVAGLGLG